MASPKNKARLVARGFRQEYGVDFDDFFPPIVKTKTLRFLVEIVTIGDLELLQLKMVFHGDKKSLYGL